MLLSVYSYISLVLRSLIWLLFFGQEHESCFCLLSLSWIARGWHFAPLSFVQPHWMNLTSYCSLVGFCGLYGSRASRRTTIWGGMSAQNYWERSQFTTTLAPLMCMVNHFPCLYYFYCIAWNFAVGWISLVLKESWFFRFGLSVMLIGAWRAGVHMLIFK
jgi:hypothetical protein